MRAVDRDHRRVQAREVATCHLRLDRLPARREHAREGGQIFERAVLLAVIAINWVRDALVSEVSRLVNQDNAQQFLWVIHWQRTEKQFVDEAE